MSIRLRLAIWYTAFLATMFVLFAPAVYFALEREMSSEVDRWLAPVATRVLGSVSENARALDSLRGSARSEPTAAQIISALSAYRDLDLERFTSPGVFVQLLDANGRVIARSPNLESRTVPVPDHAFAAAWWGSSDSFTVGVDGERYRGYLLPISRRAGAKGFRPCCPLLPGGRRIPRHDPRAAGRRQPARAAAGRRSWVGDRP